MAFLENSKRASQMSFRKKNQDLLSRITDKSVAEMVSTALRKAHHNDPSAVKRIGANTGIKIHTIPKWYHAQNAPKSSHLMILAASYPSVLKAMLTLIGKSNTWSANTDDQPLDTVPKPLTKEELNGGLYSDKFVRLSILFPIEAAYDLNIRQLWFLGELQIGNNVRVQHISKLWKVSSRTGKRDIRQLIDFGFVQYLGSPKNGHYIFTG